MSLCNNKALEWHLMEAGTGLGEMTKPLARSFISRPKTSGEECAPTRTHTHARGGQCRGDMHFLNFP